MECCDSYGRCTQGKVCAIRCVKDTENAYKRGQRDAAAGKSQQDNPFKKDSLDANLWVVGYYDMKDKMDMASVHKIKNFIKYIVFPLVVFVVLCSLYFGS